MKQLNGNELAGYIKERQARQVRALRQAHDIEPRLAIIKTINDPVIDTYVSLKQRYGKDILIEVDVHSIAQAEASQTVAMLNQDQATHGIIIQLPLEDPTKTEELVNLVAANKDVDGLSQDSNFDPATPTAIIWLLNGYNIELTGKQFAVVGQGRLVGAPLARMLEASGYDVMTYDKETKDINDQLVTADVVISATGQPGLIQPDSLKTGCVAIDAGVAVDSGKTVGDFADGVYERDDLVLTPRKGGVGPLTVCALFENVIRAATTQI